MRDWFYFFTASHGLPFTIYVILQILAAVRLRGVRRIIVLAPSPVMVAVMIITVSAYQQQSNIWPILLILASPPAILYVIIAWVICASKKKE